MTHVTFRGISDATAYVDPPAERVSDWPLWALLTVFSIQMPSFQLWAYVPWKCRGCSKNRSLRVGVSQMIPTRRYSCSNVVKLSWFYPLKCLYWQLDYSNVDLLGWWWRNHMYLCNCVKVFFSSNKMYEKKHLGTSLSWLSRRLVSWRTPLDAVLQNFRIRTGRFFLNWQDAPEYTI